MGGLSFRFQAQICRERKRFYNTFHSPSYLKGGCDSFCQPTAKSVSNQALSVRAPLRRTRSRSLTGLARRVDAELRGTALM
jgi:hypothetical protein